MNTHQIFGRHWVRGDDTPDPNWIHTGELIRTTQGMKPIYKEVFPNLQKKPLTVNGEVQWVKHPTTGQPLWMRMQQVVNPDAPSLEKEFILWDNGTGMTYKNYHFRPNAQDKARETAQRELSPEQLIEKLAALQNQYEALAAQLHTAPVGVDDTDIDDDGIDVEAELALAESEPSLE